MEKINIAELLKDCPKGMELDCTIFEDVHFDCIDDVSNIINCYIQDSKHKIGISFSKYGCYSNISKSKCVIFPKGKTTWEGFQRPFKDGDVVFFDDSIAIFKEWGDETLFRTYVKQYIRRESIDIGFPLFGRYIRKETRFATAEEKQKLFDAIKANGYKWNPETKTLEKLIESNNREDIGVLLVTEPDNWELVHDKFDITTLKPFKSRVLIRDGKTDIWNPAIWGYLRKGGMYAFPYIVVGGLKFNQCIPYEGNEHLLGTTNDCDDFYKTWE